MNTALLTLLAVVAVGVAYVLVPVGIDAYSRLRGARLVTCPDTRTAVAVDLDARLGAVTVLCGRPALRVKECARWQDDLGRNCAQRCLQGIDALAARDHGLLTRPLQTMGSSNSRNV